RHPSRSEVAHWLISAAMPELELSGFSSDSTRKQLMAKAYSEIGDSVFDNPGDELQTGVEVGRIAGSRRHDDAVGTQTANFVQLCTERNHGNPDLAPNEIADDVLLHATVDDDNVRPQRGIEILGFRRRNLSDDVVLTRQSSGFCPTDKLI